MATGVVFDGKTLDDAVRKGLEALGLSRAAVSIASNIAEGSERTTAPDFVRFLNIAKGSAAELRTQIYIAERVGILTIEQQRTHIADLKQISAMLHALAKSIQSKIKKN